MNLRKNILLYLNYNERVVKEAENRFNYAINNFDRNNLALKYLEIIKNVSNA